MIEFAGWISSLAFSLCGLPQVLHTWRTGKTDGLSTAFLVLWLSGEVFGFIYITGFEKIPLPIAANYTLNTLAIGYLMYKKYKKET